MEIERKNKKYDDITSNILKTLQRENDDISARAKSLDSRAGMILAFLITAFPIYTNFFGTDRFYKLFHQTSFSFLEAVAIISFIVSVLLFLITLLFLILVLCTRKYYAVNTEWCDDFNIIEYEDMDTTVNDVNVWLIKQHYDVGIYNGKVVAKKAKLFDKALWICFSFMGTTVCTILLMLY